MNILAKAKGLSKVGVLNMEEMKFRGMSDKHAKEDIESLPSFPYVEQKEWTHRRPDGIQGNHYNLTQLPSEVEVSDDGFSKDYHILQTPICLVLSRRKYMDTTLFAPSLDSIPFSSDDIVLVLLNCLAIMVIAFFFKFSSAFIFFLTILGTNNSFSMKIWLV